MKTRVKKNYSVVAHITPEDKQAFVSLAAYEDVPSSAILRRLIKGVLRGKLSLDEVLKKTNGGISGGRMEIRTRLTEKDKLEFFSVAEEWDYLPGTLARLLVGFYIQAKL